MVKVHVMPPTDLEQMARVLNVGAQERGWVVDGAVVVTLLGKVDDRIMPVDDAIQQSDVAAVAHHELHALSRQACDVLGVAGVGKFVEHGHADPGRSRTTHRTELDPTKPYARQQQRYSWVRRRPAQPPFLRAPRALAGSDRMVLILTVI